MKKSSHSQATNPYGAWATLAFAAIILTLLVISQLVAIGIFAYLLLPQQIPASIALLVQQGTYNGSVVSLSIFSAAICCILLIFLLIKLKQTHIKHYLALQQFSWKVARLFLGIFIAYVAMTELLATLLNKTPMAFFEPLYYTAKPVWLIWLAVVLVAPVYEEVIFRGFLWQGLVNSRLGLVGASLITSGLFTLIHASQYGWFELMAVFSLGMLLAFARHFSHSLWLPILLHILNNGLSMLVFVLV